MPHFEAKMSSKGQLTVPAVVRELFRLKEGDRVDFYVEPNSRVVRITARNGKLADLEGLLGDVPAASPDEIDEAIGAHLAEEDERIKTSWDEWRDFQEWRRVKAQKAAE